MTSENYRYRTDPLFLRNSYYGTGKFDIPIIPKAKFNRNEFDNLLLIGFDRASETGSEHFDRMVHFFLYDYKFEKVWMDPEKQIAKVKNYKAVLTPDFSMYIDMAFSMQLYNTFRNRWCGAYFASKGLRVVPTVNWGLGQTFDFCFDGIEKGTVVAVSTYMVQERHGKPAQKEFFMAGYREMMRRIEPEKIICYHTPFDEMEGDIVYIDYELSGWRYMNAQSYEAGLHIQGNDCNFEQYKI